MVHSRCAAVLLAVLVLVVVRDVKTKSINARIRSLNLDSWRTELSAYRENLEHHDTVEEVIEQLEVG